MQIMKSHLSSGVLAGLLCVSTLFFTNCSSSPSKAGGEAGGTTQLTGAGSTFVYPLMSRWAADYHQLHPNVQINYQSIGSGGGIQQLKQGLVDFGASDMALGPDKLKEMPPLVQVPETAGPVCITYNLPQLKQPLKLTAKAISGIYLGTIKTWQDPEIKRENPGVNLPKQNIAVAHRSDGSGTSNIFTTYLSAVSPEWKSKVGEGLSVAWPVGIGGKGNEGVTGVVKQNPGAVGYVELAYAQENNLPVADVQNKAGKFVAPSAEGTSAAIDAFSAELQKDVAKPIVDPPASAPEAYPISGLTFLLVPTNPKDAQRGAQTKAFIEYVIGPGQAAAEPLHYAKLPSSLDHIDQILLAKIQSPRQGG
jgi:phosphate transport system substrate-binding protein